MTNFILKIYDFLKSHRSLCILSFTVVTGVLLALLTRLEFKEEISDFLPLDDRQMEALSVYQDVSGAGKILAIFQSSDTTATGPDKIVEAMEVYENHLAQNDSTGMVRHLVADFDLESINETADFVYGNIPYFLTEEDYARMDSLLSDPAYVGEQLERDKELLMFPTSGFLSAHLQKDPLNLFSPTVSKIQRGNSDNIETYQGRIFSPDMKRAVILMESPFGNSETKQNARLMDMLENTALATEAASPEVEVHYIGGPAIAVGNASQIKNDSVLSVIIALVLIVGLLVVVFRKFWNILLIVISVGWGWLFALALLTVIHSSVSLIVIGISSIILGIAVNYPLHLLAHMDHATSMRRTLREIITPLIIGNITTVGAFLALVPLQAAALRDLGIFAAFILIGTILFVVVYLPHAAQKRKGMGHGHQPAFLTRISNLRPERSAWIVWAVVILTCVFGYFSQHTRFDANMSHINYLNDQQKGDMEYLREFSDGHSASFTTLYVVTDADNMQEALRKGAETTAAVKKSLAGMDSVTISDCHRFLPSKIEQQRRLALWQNFVAKHGELLQSGLGAEAAKAGFQTDAFEPFQETMTAQYAPKEFEEFEPLHTIFSTNLSTDSIRKDYRVVDQVVVPNAQLERAKQSIEAAAPEALCFDVQGMNSSLANGLSDNFNYIGWACGLIVFFFLWFSFASIELALLSFLPMALSWIWILGIMGATGIEFNIVNIILATFIFGQGDDYTIFMTEGCCYEYAHRRKMLASFKSSIIVSALIMFIGIGTLILAKHPALHSLAEVTIVGMFSVVLMAYLIPPLVFNWIVKSHGQYRKRPLTLIPILRTWLCGTWWIGQLLGAYVVGFFLFVVGKRGPKSELIFHKMVTRAHRLDLRLMPGVRFRLHNPHNESFAKPSVIVCNHQSLLDPMFFMALNPKILIVANERSSRNPVVRIMFKWLGFYTIKQSNFTAWKDSTLDRDMEVFRKYVEQGYSIAFFPEGARNPESCILRCHKGPFYLAHKLNIDVLPIMLHGVNNLMPIRSFACYPGDVNMHIGERITPGSTLWCDGYAPMTLTMHKKMIRDYNALKRTYENADFFAPLVKDRYRYKGTEMFTQICKNLKRNRNYADWIDSEQPQNVIILNAGFGEVPLLMALVHPEIRVTAHFANEEERNIALYAAEGIADNLELKPMEEFNPATLQNCKVYDLSNTVNYEPETASVIAATAGEHDSNMGAE